MEQRWATTVLKYAWPLLQKERPKVAEQG